MRLRELFLREAAYDTKVIAMRKKWDNDPLIGNELSWSRQALGKSDRIMWYLNLVDAYIAHSRGQSTGFQQLLGGYNFTSLDDLKQQLVHFYGVDDPAINQYQFKKQTVNQLIDDLAGLEQQWIEKNQKNQPLSLQSSDYELIKFNDHTAWYFVDRAYCPEEGRSGLHCGNVAGQTATDQRLLSFRVNGHVQMTFVLLPDGKLGEMKAKANQKPPKKFHPYIVSLLLHPMIKGIKGAGYLPQMNFSLFDLSQKDFDQVISEKPNFLTDQTAADPMGVFSLPDKIRADLKVQNAAMEQMPGLSYLLNRDGSVNQSLDHWKLAVKSDPVLLMFAPEDYPNRPQLLVQRLLKSPHDLLKCPDSVFARGRVIFDVLAQRPGYLGYIAPLVPRYREFCMAAVLADGTALNLVPEHHRTVSICMSAVKTNGLAIKYVPRQYRNQELCIAALTNPGREYQTVMAEIPDHLKTAELYLAGVEANPNVFKLIPGDQVTAEMVRSAVAKDGALLAVTPEHLKTNEVCRLAVDSNHYALLNVPLGKITEPMAFSAVSQGGIVLGSVPERLRTLRVCLKAMETAGSLLHLVPGDLRTREVCAQAMSSSSQAHRHVPRALMDDQMGMAVVKIMIDRGKPSDPLAVLPPSLRTEKVLTYAVGLNGRLLSLIHDYQKTREMCAAAVKNDGNVLRIVPHRFITADMCMDAVKNNFRAIAHVPESMLTTELCMAAIKSDPKAIKLIKNPTEEMIRAAGSQQ